MLYIILSVLIAAALGYLLNVVANLTQPHIEKRTRLIMGSVVFLLVATIAIAYKTKQNDSPDVINPVSAQNTETTSDLTPHSMYGTEARIAEGKSYVDPGTGFVFAVDEISNFWLSRVLAPNAGVLCRYTLPDGTASDMYRRKVGTRVDFQYLGRKYYMAITDVDYSQKVATIVIKEIPSR